jgi:hypothetical protein
MLFSVLSKAFFPETRSAFFSEWSLTEMILKRIQMSRNLFFLAPEDGNKSGF